MLKIIAAIGKNREIGKDNKLLWHIPADLKHFKNLTLNKTIIMGLNTYYSIGKPLKDRKNIIISDIEIKGVKVYNNIEKCLKENQDAFIIGGESIYRQTIKYADELHLSLVDESFDDADRFFPEFENDFKLVSSEPKEGFTYNIYIRK